MFGKIFGTGNHVIWVLRKRASDMSPRQIQAILHPEALSSICFGGGCELHILILE